ncbi:MAG: PAS domain S-box protein [Bacteroidota bacterium]|nr:PAS domain S-box protein [Bacteroidota bacterium]
METKNTSPELKNNFSEYRIILIPLVTSIVVILATFLLFYFNQNKLILILTSLVLIVSTIINFWIIYQKVWLPLKNSNLQQKGIYAKFYSQILENEKLQNQASEWLQQISEGKINENLQIDTKNNHLLYSISQFQKKLQQISIEENKRSWAVNGQAKFGQLLREKLNADLQELAYAFISELTKYIHANQGGIYLIETDEEGNEYIKLSGCYAYGRKKHHTQELAKDEGLIGQCIYEKDTILLTDVPKDYIKITSGLGEALPNCVIIVPIILNDEVFGAIELASFEVIEKYKIEFLEKTAESFASIYASTKNNRNMEKLYLESQKNAEELRAKENALLQNEEELRAAQENLSQKLVELMAESNLTKSINEAINKSNASIQFDMDGNILDANEMFLAVMGYKKEELIGKNETVLIPEDELMSNRYSMLWESLKQGVFNSGEFRRIGKDGKEVWIDVTYNPILDLNDKPFKILMLAIFTTEAKVRENEFRNKINAMNETLAMIELNSDFSIKSSNQKFLDKMHIKRKDLKDSNFIDMLYNGFNEDADISMLKKSLIEGQSQKSVCVFANSDKKPVPFFTTISIGNDINGKLQSYYVMMHEIEWNPIEQ